MGGRSAALLIDGEAIKLNLPASAVLELESMSARSLTQRLKRIATDVAAEREAIRLDKIVKDIKSGKRKAYTLPELKEKWAL